MAEAKLEMKDIRECEQYMTVAQAANFLGVKKASMFFRIYEHGLFPNVRRVGGDAEGEPISGDRPILLLLKSEVLAAKQSLTPKGRLAVKLQMKDIPECPDYITVARAAKIFGIKKTSMFYKIYDKGLFPNVCRVGGSDGALEHGDHSILLLLRSEVLAVKAAEDKARKFVPPPTPEQLLKEWNRRVKDWGSERPDTFGPIWAAGRPTEALTAAYLEAHPDDPRPV